MVEEQSNGIRNGQRSRGEEGTTVVNIHILQKAPLLLLLFMVVKGGLKNPLKKVPRTAMSSTCKWCKPKGVRVLL